MIASWIDGWLWHWVGFVILKFDTIYCHGFADTQYRAVIGYRRRRINLICRRWCFFLICSIQLLVYFKRNLAVWSCSFPIRKKINDIVQISVFVINKENIVEKIVFFSLHLFTATRWHAPFFKSIFDVDDKGSDKGKHHKTFHCAFTTEYKLSFI